MIMKRLVLTLAAMLALFTANAEEKTKTYDFGDITSINAGGTYQIHVTEGKSKKVKVVYDDAIEKYQTLDVRYSGGTLNLFIKQAKPLKNWTDNSKIHVYLEMDDIYDLDLSGAANATFTGEFRTENLDLDISGAASLNDLVINGQSMEADITGAASAGVAGNFSKIIEVDISGAAKLTLKSDAEILEADISGASKFKCTGNFKECEISCSGASNAEMEGKVGKADYECSGASNIDAQDLVAKTVDVELTGASKAKVNASEDLYYNVSRSSKMTYYGDAKLHNRNTDTNVVRGR